MFTERCAGRVMGVVVVVALVGGMVWGAGAASRPVGKDMVEMKSEPFGVGFRVPKAWKRLETSADPKCIFMFETARGGVAGKPAAARAPTTMKASRYFHVYFGQPCERQKKLEEVVKDTRGWVQQKNPGVAFKKDEAADVSGREAWTLVWPQKQTFTVTEVRNGKSSQRQIEVEVWRQKTLWLQNETICEYGMEADAAAFPGMEKVAEQVRESFQWDEAAKPAKGG